MQNSGAPDVLELYPCKVEELEELMKLELYMDFTMEKQIQEKISITMLLQELALD